MSKTDYEINHSKVYNDATKGMDEELTQIENAYGGMINQADKYYQDQINASKEYAATQMQNQQAQTDFAIEKIEQQKDQAQKDYTKEQSGAYVDWQKQSNQYGANAEQMAAQGMTNTGYSESSQVSMYNTYQNRIVAARESYTRAVLNYDNAIKDAQLQNNAVLAEIAYNALQQQLELSLQGFQYKNQLLLDKMEKKTEVKNTYWQRYQDMLAQINEENKLKESVRQHDETIAETIRNNNLDYKIADRQMKLAEKEYEGSKSESSSIGGGGGSDGIKKTSTSSKPSVNVVKGIGDYKSAMEFMKDNNLTEGKNRLLRSDVWNRGKRQGHLASEFEYNSYAEYVQNYLIWRINNS